MVKEIEDQSGEEVDRKREGRVGGVTALPSWMISQDLGKSLGLQEAVLYSLGPECVCVCECTRTCTCAHTCVLNGLASRTNSDLLAPMPDPQAKDT